MPDKNFSAEKKRGRTIMNQKKLKNCNKTAKTITSTGDLTIKNPHILELQRLQGNNKELFTPSQPLSENALLSTLKTPLLLACAVLLTAGMAGADDLSFGTSNDIIWTKTNAQGVSEYTFSDNLTVPLSSTPNYVTDANGYLQSADGAIRFYYGNEVKYYIYEYSNSLKTQASNTRLNNLSSDVSNTYFYNLSNDNGGAIYNEGNGNYSISADFIGNTAYDMSGGAIYNGGKISQIMGNFIENIADGFGGAICNEQGTISSITADFINNKTYSGYGGAISNYGIISNISGDFIGNTSYYGLGGAIFNASPATITSLTGNFIGNTAGEHGGAIANYGVISLIANNKNIMFNNNIDESGYNDIHQIGGRINLNAAEYKNITFNGTITGDSYSYGRINVNDSTKNAAVGGEYIFNNEISYNNINLASGAKVNFGTATQADNSTTYGSMTSGIMTVNGTNARLGSQNNRIDSSAIVTNLTLNNAVKLAIDVSLSSENSATPSADTVISSNITNNTGLTSGYLIIDAINLLTGSNEATVQILLTEDSVLKLAYTLSDDIVSNVTTANDVEYTVQSVDYDNTTGILTINAGGTSVNPQAENDSADTDISVELPSYLNIQEINKVAGATAQVVNETTLNLSTSPSVTYKVDTNAPANVYLSGEAKTGNSTYKALYGDSTEAMTLVFTNDNGDATSSNIENCVVTSPTSANNANAIAFTLTCANPSVTTGMVAPTVTPENGVIQYSVNPGETTLNFSVANSAKSGTFFANDPAGIYKATLIISSVAP